jgi:hypothetical protein
VRGTGPVGVTYDDDCGGGVEYLDDCEWIGNFYASAVSL